MGRLVCLVGPCLDASTVIWEDVLIVILFWGSSLVELSVLAILGFILAPWQSVLNAGCKAA